MNIVEAEILKLLSDQPHADITQRYLAEQTGFSLGKINEAVKALATAKLINADLTLTQSGRDRTSQGKPQNAIILAAGYGLRMIPISQEIPKAFLEVHGEILIERLIEQLHEAGIYEIHIVVGFMKESFDYLIDKYNVDLIVNKDYSSSNNLHSLALASDHLGNTYIVPCDIWCRHNPFHTCELYSWYMVGDWLIDDESTMVRSNRRLELVPTYRKKPGNAMLGVCYLTSEHSVSIRQKFLEWPNRSEYHKAFWESVLFTDPCETIMANIVSHKDVFELNTYEQLRSLDTHSQNLNTSAITCICHVFSCRPDDILDIQVLKKGMTNRSFLFSYNDQKYIMRIPGEGTDHLINRRQEAQVYNRIKDFHLCDDIYYIDPANGYKITAFFSNYKVCDPSDENDLKACMQMLKHFHNLNLKVRHTFHLFRQIEFYEKLRQKHDSVFRDYQETKQHVFELKEYIDSQEKHWTLTHIDAVPDNFLFIDSDQNNIRLIDWEYAGMQDAHVDIAMFCIYALYDRAQIERLIDFYFEFNCPQEIRLKIYCYIAVCGLLWSNWCEYKRLLGVEFGEYSLKQYRYAKDYYKIFKSEHTKYLEANHEEHKQ